MIVRNHAPWAIAIPLAVGIVVFVTIEVLRPQIAAFRGSGADEAQRISDVTAALEQLEVEISEQITRKERHEASPSGEFEKNVLERLRIIEGRLRARPSEARSHSQG
jgi:hypothetical protein